MRCRRGLAAAALLGALLASGCQDDRFPNLSPAAKAGWEVFRVNCLLCHMDPQKDSPVGPALAGSSLELLRAKVLEARYPPGYQPKRPGPITMPVQPQVASKLESIAAFLAEVGR